MMYDYIGPLGSSHSLCNSLGIEGYLLRTDELASELKVQQKTLKNFDYYMLKIGVGFMAADLSDKHNIDFGVKRAELELRLEGGRAKAAFPRDERNVEKSEVE